MTEDDLVAAFEAAWTNEGFLSREHEEARLAAGRAALRRFREEQLRPGRRHPGLRGAGVQLPARRGPGPRPVRPGGHHARATARRRARTPAACWRRRAPRRCRRATSSSPRCSPPEHVVITDYKSSDVRDPAKARERAKESLQLSIYAMGYEAMTGRLPDDVALHFLESGPGGHGAGGPQADRQGARVHPDGGDRDPGAGVRRRSRTYLACTWCAFREICPSSAAR